jgi:chromatin structure-remodeling complex subunit RSC1/2
MQIENWERIIDPPMEKSPFLRGIRGPGFFAEPREGGEEEEEDETPRRRQPEAVTKRSSAAAVTPARAYVPATQAGRYLTPTYPQSTPSASTYRPPPSNAPQQRPTTGQPALLPSTNGRTIAALMGGPQVVDQVAVREYLPIEVGKYALPPTFWRRKLMIQPDCLREMLGIRSYGSLVHHYYQAKSRSQLNRPIL